MSSTKTKDEIVRPKAADVLPKVGNSLTEKPEPLIIWVKPKNAFHKWLIKHNLSPSKRTYEIHPIRVKNIYRIATRSVTFDLGKLFKTTDNIGALMDIINRHYNDMVYIVACCVQNNHKEPTKELLWIVDNEFEMQDFQTVLDLSVLNYNIPAFLTSITLIVGVDALNVKVSPKENES